MLPANRSRNTLCPCLLRFGNVMHPLVEEEVVVGQQLELGLWYDHDGLVTSVLPGVSLEISGSEASRGGGGKPRAEG
jgi:hypothetical protein